jgi:uncharacterized cysteine cluster protein YcgN (CxxCxxCC family)
MIVCDRCGKPVYHKSNFTAKIKALIKTKECKLHPTSSDTFIDYDIHYDFCQECLDDVIKNLREFAHQGKFNGELNNG